LNYIDNLIQVCSQFYIYHLADKPINVTNYTCNIVGDKNHEFSDLRR